MKETHSDHAKDHPFFATDAGKEFLEFQTKAEVNISKMQENIIPVSIFSATLTGGIAAIGAMPLRRRFPKVRSLAIAASAAWGLNFGFTKGSSMIVAAEKALADAGEIRMQDADNLSESTVTSLLSVPNIVLLNCLPELTKIGDTISKNQSDLANAEPPKYQHSETNQYNNNTARYTDTNQYGNDAAQRSEATNQYNTNPSSYTADTNQYQSQSQSQSPSSYTADTNQYQSQSQSQSQSQQQHHETQDTLPADDYWKPHTPKLSSFSNEEQEQGKTPQKLSFAELREQNRQTQKVLEK